MSMKGDAFRDQQALGAPDESMEECWTCGGEGFGALGHDFTNDDPVNEPDGKIIPCPNCRGSGLGKDCRYW